MSETPSNTIRLTDKSFFVIVAIFAGTVGGNLLTGLVTGTPRDAATTIQTASETASNELSNELAALREVMEHSLEDNTRLVLFNNYLVNARIDSLRREMIQGFANVDGYLKNQPTPSNNSRQP